MKTVLRVTIVLFMHFFPKILRREKRQLYIVRSIIGIALSLTSKENKVSVLLPLGNNYLNNKANELKREDICMSIDIDRMPIN